MSRPFFYCSELARASRELSFGTASVGRLWLLVEYREAWGAHALADSALSAPLKRHLEKLCQSIPRMRLLFIKQERMNARPLRCFLVRCRELAPSIEQFELDSYDDLLRLDANALADGASPAGSVKMSTPLYLVCTHGKRDKCCAKFGYALYKSLHAGEADGGVAAGANVWQSSHVGGDRFAANLVCFPHGLFYAHVTEEAGGRIMEEYERGQLVLEGYRGRACYSYPVQAAEFFIRAETNLTALTALRYRRHERTADNSWRVAFVETHAPTDAPARVHEAEIAARPSEFHNYITCQSAEQRPVIQYALENYRVT
ncbi:MAG TPA: sucrase ferredoxin [Pyrinomonadaceae bacterium]|nr:sucrase ferredoxin [Pyrinomonadaceae bacterium]